MSALRGIPISFFQVYQEPNSDQMINWDTRCYRKETLADLITLSRLVPHNWNSMRIASWNRDHVWPAS